jgi:hypothetical protein
MRVDLLVNLMMVHISGTAYRNCIIKKPDEGYRYLGNEILRPG